MDWTDKVRSILAKADTCVTGGRQEDYGTPENCFRDIAFLWSVLFDTHVTMRQVALANILQKVVRETHRHKEDNAIDIAGYAAILAALAADESEITEEPKGAQPTTCPECGGQMDIMDIFESHIIYRCRLEAIRFEYNRDTGNLTLLSSENIR